MTTIMHVDSVDIQLQTGVDILDITAAIETVVEHSGVVEGQVSAFMVGSTGSITTIEYESGVIEDLKDAVNRLASPGMDYAHERAWHDGNGHSHVQAAMLGPSLTVPVRNRQLRLGTWQQIVAVNHDNKPRRRTIEVTVFGS